MPIFGGYRLRQQLWTLNQLDHRLRQFLSWPSLLRSLNNCGWQRPSDYVGKLLTQYVCVQPWPIFLTTLVRAAAEAQLKGSIALVIVDIALGLLFGLFLYQHRAVSGTVLSYVLSSVPSFLVRGSLCRRPLVAIPAMQQLAPLWRNAACGSPALPY